MKMATKSALTPIEREQRRLTQRVKALKAATDRLREQYQEDSHIILDKLAVTQALLKGLEKE